MDLFDYATSQPKEEQEKKEDASIYTVSEVTVEIKHLLAQHFLPKHPISIEGELSNFRGRNSSGHMYFSLKDEKAIIPCVFFRFANAKCKTTFKEGSLVVAKGKIEVYEKGGKYQLVIQSMSEKGKGELYEKFLQLKQKLQEQGLFDPNHKKEIPKYPSRIGVVTSETGSVIKDIIHVIENRAPNVDIVLFPCKVQGDNASEMIARQIQRAQQSQYGIDVLIVGRGGGSIEDLWAFNEEVVAKSIFDSSVPVISAVGHQTDFTICDFVADQRAATPSQAAEVAVPDLTTLSDQIHQCALQMIYDVKARIHAYRGQLERWTSSKSMKDPRSALYQRIQYIDDLTLRLKERLKHVTPLYEQKSTYLQKQLVATQVQKMKQYQQRLDQLSSQLKVLDPTNILSRGYSIVKTKDGSIISHKNNVQVKDEINVTVSDGDFECIVNKI